MKRKGFEVSITIPYTNLNPKTTYFAKIDKSLYRINSACSKIHLKKIINLDT